MATQAHKTQNATSYNTDANQPIRDAQGRTEAEFLAAYSPKDYPRPSLTADTCLFRAAPDGLKLLLIKRGGHPYLGQWALPGGFVNPEEDALQAACRELAEETGLITPQLEPVGLYSTPGRDPRSWVVSQAFVGLIDPAPQAGSESAPIALDATPVAQDDAREAVWFDLDICQVSKPKHVVEVTLTLRSPNSQAFIYFEVERAPYSGRLCASHIASGGLAFDHAHIIAQAFLTLPPEYLAKYCDLQ